MRKKFTLPDLDMDVYDNMISIFNDMLEYNDIEYEVVICKGAEEIELIKID